MQFSGARFLSAMIFQFAEKKSFWRTARIFCHKLVAPLCYGLAESSHKEEDNHKWETSSAVAVIADRTAYDVRYSYNLKHHLRDRGWAPWVVIEVTDGNWEGEGGKGRGKRKEEQRRRGEEGGRDNTPPTIPLPATHSGSLYSRGSESVVSRHCATDFTASRNERISCWSADSTMN